MTITFQRGKMYKLHTNMKRRSSITTNDAMETQIDVNRTFFFLFHSAAMEIHIFSVAIFFY